MNIKQVWKIGDCLELLPDIPDRSIELVATDPPYCIGTTSNGHKANWLDNNLVLPFFEILLKELKRTLRRDGEIYIHTDWRTYPFLYYPISKYFDIKNLIVWDYEWIKAGSHYRFSHEFIIYAVVGGEGTHKRKFSASERDVWRIPPINFTSGDKQHQAEKPIKLIEKIISNSTSVGDTVLDPFLGSGTTLEACRNLNRNCIGFDISDEWVPNYRKRLRLDDSKLTDTWDCETMIKDA